MLLASVYTCMFLCLQSNFQPASVLAGLASNNYLDQWINMLDTITSFPVNYLLYFKLIITLLSDLTGWSFLNGGIQ